MAKRPVGIDLFAGAGGMSLGFEQAGFDVVAAVEIDPVHSAIHKFNFPDCAVIPNSIKELTGKAIREASGIGQRKVDVVFGGPPCQGFSLIGGRAIDDPRNSLVVDFVRIVSELDASYFLFENVKGLTIGKHRKFLEEVIAAFDRAGYEVLLPWKVLNAADYGVPQDRQRLFLLGVKKGKSLPDYPKPTHCRPKSSNKDLPPSPTCQDALDDLPNAEDFKTLLFSDEVQTKAWGKPSSYARMMRCLDDEGWGFSYRRDWNPPVLTCSRRTEHTEISKRRFSATEPGSVEPISRFFRLPARGLSNTLRAGTDSARGAFTSPRPIHYAYPRCITVREMARLHGFPDWFRFHATKWHGARQIGNAVPPPLAKAIATQIVAALGIQPECPKEVIQLGNPELLRMDMSEASAYWRIDIPIDKRNRKSGATKRKQEEIELIRLEEASYV
ncbi:MAG: DNA cytosine methyltransferase [Acaryochloridaceae cyanobacterium RU_4_10]|nr:DNA cytosine methyltransferase [Acaryochloridaceae cyanobacterium RU_4_10]